MKMVMKFWCYKSRKTYDRPNINCLLIHCILTFESYIYIYIYIHDPLDQFRNLITCTK